MSGKLWVIIIDEKTGKSRWLKRSGQTDNSFVGKLSKVSQLESFVSVMSFFIMRGLRVANISESLMLSVDEYGRSSYVLLLKLELKNKLKAFEMSTPDVYNWPLKVI